MTDDHQLDPAELERVGAVVTRVVRARIRDAVEAEDLVQETLTRFLVERERGDVRDPDHYAATIALNLIRARWRRLAREGEVLPLLVDLREPSEPVDLAVDGEVSDVLSAALDELDEERRRLLVEHELAGRSTSELADASTPAAVAASLARTRARLRVDVVVRYRRAALPTSVCRPVLESLSANDARRQDRLGATAHLEACETCAELADVIGRRGTAWLTLAPMAALFQRRSAQAGVVAVVAAAVVAIAVSVGDDRADAGARPATSSPPVEVAEPAVPDPPASPDPQPVDPPDPQPAPAPVAPSSTVTSPVTPSTASPSTDTVPTDVEDGADDPPVERTAPVIELPVEIGPLGDSLVLDHPLIDPLEPVICPILGLPKPITGCTTDAPSDLVLAP